MHSVSANLINLKFKLTSMYLKTSITPEGLAVILFIVYWLVLEYLRSINFLERHNLSSYGPLLILRTKKGLNLLEKLSRPKKLWRVFATLGIPMVFLGMVFMFSLIIFMDIVMLKSPPPPSSITSPRNVLLIPWVNTLFPPLYLLLALIVTLVVHEFSHAILCRVEGIKVKALGILLLLVPIGGFAEPDEKELEKNANRIQKVRIFSAGVISNFSLATIAFILFILLLNFLQPTVFIAHSKNPEIHAGEIVYSINGIKVFTPSDVTTALKLNRKKLEIVTDNGTYILPCVAGVEIAKTYPGYPAYKAGMKEGMIIYMVNNTYTPTLEAFEEFMSKTKPGQILDVHVYYNNKKEVFHVKLTKSPYSNSGFLGVEVYEYISGLELGYSSVLLEELKSLPYQLKSIRGLLFFVAMPLMGFKGFIGQATKYFKPEILGGYLFVILTSLYWIGWVNFYVGLFNCLPAIPLDGGRVFYEAFTWILNKLGLEGDKIAGATVKYLAYLIFASLIMSVVVPNIAYLKRL